MSDKSLILELPEELLHRAQAAHLDLRQVLIEAIERKLPASTDDIQPSLEEIETTIRESMQRIESGSTDLRILGLHAGTISVHDDFDAPLPDEFWLGGNP
jgi:hypothetical protein